MKNIKNIQLIFFLILCVNYTTAQRVKFGDRKVKNQKLAIATELGIESLVKNKQISLLKEMKELEDELFKKRNALASIRNSPLVFSTIAIIEFTDQKIHAILRRKSFIAVQPKKLKHGLKRITSALHQSTNEINEIRGDYDTLIASALISGGAGQNYKAFLKVLIRAVEIRNEVLQIEHSIKNLNSLNKMFFP